MKIAVLITCHDRCETTLRCLNALFVCHFPDNAMLEVFLVDDGSTDGTASAIQNVYPQVKILQGDGRLYWTGGMHKAFAAAMVHNFDYYLWLNDDTFLYPQAIDTLLKAAEDIYHNENKAAVVIGSTQAEVEGPVNHGGVIVNGSWWNTNLVVPGDKPIPCDTLNGNCVLISKGVVECVGNLDSTFIHTMGDIDYGFRVRAFGFPLVVMPGFAGICHSNPIVGTYQDVSLPLRMRLSKIAGVKGRPLRPWFIFLWRHFGCMGLIYWMGTYAKVFWTWLREYVRKRVRQVIQVMDNN